ncbi:MAG TPA: hypothetical protein VMT89_14495 [Candidatus Acidoferrales bacterium]|nr:hypothetical protein [Candidatus Acidoferrales bacterium]
MTHVDTFDRAHSSEHATSMTAAYREGFVGGTLAALTIVIWFLIIDVINGRPFYTPTVLGTALFQGGKGLESPATLTPTFDMVVVFTWIHFLVFGLIGGAAARMLAVAENRPNFGFGVVLLFVIFECGFVAAATGVEAKVLRSIAWPAIAAGNLLAATVMASYFQRRHRHMSIRP